MCFYTAILFAQSTMDLRLRQVYVQIIIKIGEAKPNFVQGWALVIEIG
jgi:hypothetical protein